MEKRISIKTAKSKRNTLISNAEDIYEIAGINTPDNSNCYNKPPVRQKEIQRRGKTVVNVRVVFLKIGEIDTVKETFMAEIFVESRWKEPIFDNKKDNLIQSTVNFEDYWTPRIYVANNAGEMKETVWHEVDWNLQGEGILVERRRIKSAFIENLELWNFPFDEQDLSVTILSERPIEEVELQEERSKPSCINKFGFIDEQEWHLFNYVNTTVRVIGKFYEESGKVNHHSIDFSCKTLRRSGFFVWNTFFVLFLLCSMTFTTFSVTYVKPENRLQLTFILLLTTVAFRTNVNNTLPKISYLTLMDKYIIYSMVIQCVVCVWHAIVGGALHCFNPCKSSLTEDFIYMADKIALIVTGSVYLLSLLAFFAWLYFGILKKFRSLESSEKYYQKRLGTIIQRDEHSNELYTNTQ